MRDEDQDYLSIVIDQERAFTERRHCANERIATCIAAWLVAQFFALALPYNNPHGIVLSGAWFLVLGTSAMCGIYTLWKWSLLSWRSRLAGLAPWLTLIAFLTLFAWLWIQHPGSTRNLIYR